MSSFMVIVACTRNNVWFDLLNLEESLDPIRVKYWQITQERIERVGGQIPGFRANHCLLGCPRGNYCLRNRWRKLLFNSEASFVSFNRGRPCVTGCRRSRARLPEVGRLCVKGAID